MTTVDRTTPRGTTASPDITLDELRLAGRNHALPLEALRADITPVGLHYLLTHYDIPFVDPAQWRLTIAGAVGRSLELTLDELRQRPNVTAPVTLECAGNGRALLSPRTISQPWLYGAVGTGEWTGTPLKSLLDAAGVSDDVVDIVFTGLDRGVEGGLAQHYERGLPLAEARRDEVLIAYELNGRPLPPQHGFPARLLVPGWYGMTSVKWLSRITAVTEAFTGYQNAKAYRIRQDADDDGTPVSRIVVRSLMAPPGLPEFATRRRVVGVGRVEVMGRAWSGTGPIQRVEFSADGGTTWDEADVEPETHPFAWQRWTHLWEASTGEHELCCRATDAAGNVQPLESAWHHGGYAVNAVHRISVTVP